jgi:23S rRNA (adenine1618-N6)-methyltransferase
MRKTHVNKNQPNNNNKPTSDNKGFHARNLHTQGYDFPALMKSYPALKQYVKATKYSKNSIDFSDPIAVKTLNTALLKYHYGISMWDIPQGYLCPPIPGRVDYIHYVAELLKINRVVKGKSPKAATIKMLDIGTGANGIYSLLASQIYGWHCTGTDIDHLSLANVSKVISDNPALDKQIELRRQYDKSHIFEGIIKAEDYFDVSVCNPPFHASQREALASNKKKVSNLASSRNEKISNRTNKGAATLNFGGQKAELWYKGGERQFLRTMIKESKQFGNQCRWFTSLVSKSDNINPAKKILADLAATDIKVIEMHQGNKVTRILAWTFLVPA